MALSPQVETNRIRYLLGLCSRAERERIESEYFEDDDAFQEMLTAEDDLIDAYARGELTDEERRRFEKLFLTSLRARDRVQFARGFAGATALARPIETTTHRTWHDALNPFRTLRGALRIATAAAVIVLVAAVFWLVTERRRTSESLSEMHTQNADIGNLPNVLPLIGDDERRGANETTVKLKSRRSESNKSKRRNGKPGNTQREGRAENPGVIVGDASLASAFANKKITELPLDARNVPNLLTLQPAKSGYVRGPKSDQTSVTLDVVDINSVYFQLSPRNASNNERTTITVANSVNSITLRLRLDATPQYIEYRATIKTADGRLVTSVDWVEPYKTTHQSIDPPNVPTVNLPTGDYVLMLAAKEPDGSIVEVAEYLFRVVRN